MNKSQQPDPPRQDSSVELERSLLEAMSNDDRLSSGTRNPDADNVLDFIQMSGLTAGPVSRDMRLPELESPDDPITFFEYGVGDVDGSGDPDRTDDPHFDPEAFKIDPVVEPDVQSESLSELRKIIADLNADDREASPGVETVVQDETAVSSQSAPTNEIAPDDRNDPPRTSETTEEVRAAARTLSHDLDKAKDLLRSLDAAEESAARTQRNLNVDPLPILPKAVEPPDSSDETVGDVIEVPPGLGLPRRRHRFPFGRWALRAAVLIAIVASAYGVFQLYRQQSQTPRNAYRAAERQLENKNYRAASNEFLVFARRFDTHPLKADALFMAGYALQQLPADPPAKAKDGWNEAIGILQQFVKEYPTHAKTPRAETLAGILYFRTGRYLEAVNILGASDRRLRDPGAYIVTLRTLGRSYAQLGQIDNARSALMRAAALENNMTPDHDYVELAGLYQGVAERSGDPEAYRRNMALAVEQWNYALQVPGLLKNRKEDIKLLRDVAESTPEKALTGRTAGAARPTAGIRIRTLSGGTQQGDTGAVTRPTEGKTPATSEE